MSRAGVFSDLLSTVLERRAPWRRDADDRNIEALCRDLLTSRGDVSGSRLGRLILDRYAALSEAERRGFFEMLADTFDLDPGKAAEGAIAYAQDRDARSLARLLDAAEPPRQELLRRLNRVDGATARLVRMRADLLPLLREAPGLARIDIDFQHLFASWFNRGFLVLRRIDWETPASVLEKLIEHEAVHAIDDWDDLRRRVQPADRRCYAFFHPAMPADPLIFVEVALTRGVPGSIPGILAEDRDALGAEAADTAVFYSISNCQEGLRGVSFGNLLIKQVAEDLARDLPHVQTFVTLSPIPGLRRWLESRAEAGETVAKDLLAAGTPDPDALRAEAARYLLEGKRADGRPLDPVARFHLNNGALAHELHADADPSANGRAQSLGAMVNYRYDLDRVEAGHEAYQADLAVPASRAVQSLARAAAPARGKARKTDDAQSAP